MAGMTTRQGNSSRTVQCSSGKITGSQLELISTAFAVAEMNWSSGGAGGHAGGGADALARVGALDAFEHPPHAANVMAIQQRARIRMVPCMHTAAPGGRARSKRPKSTQGVPALHP